MEANFYYFAAWSFILIVLATSVYLSHKGNRLAKYFLWSWALLLLAAAPFISSIPETLARHVPGVTVLFFVYTLFLIRKRNQRELEIAHEETRRVLAESNRRMDEERRRIAHRLHDDVNPKLVLSKLELQRLASLFQLHITDPEHAERARNMIEKAADFLTHAYQSSRDIIKHTRIEIIDSIGLTAAIESLVGHYRGILDKPDIKFEHNLPRRPELPNAAAVNAYRIVQEALLNAIKHAQADNVTISVYVDGKRYTVTVLDDGIGTSAHDQVGIGLIDMRERARLLDTELHIENTKGKGTRVSFSFAVRASSNHT